MTEQPRLDTFTPSTKYHADGTIEPAFYFRTYSMRFTFTRDGQTKGENMCVVGHVDISRDDTATVTFTRSL